MFFYSRLYSIWNILYFLQIVTRRNFFKIHPSELQRCVQCSGTCARHQSLSILLSFFTSEGISVFDILSETAKKYIHTYTVHTWLLHDGEARKGQIYTLQMFTHKWQINYYFCMLLLHIKICKMFKSGWLWLLQTDICVFGW